MAAAAEEQKEFERVNPDIPQMEPDIDYIKSQNWYEARPSDKNPERRAYHSSFIYNNK
jgi:hypothetical protein